MPHYFRLPYAATFDFRRHFARLPPIPLLFARLIRRRHFFRRQISDISPPIFDFLSPLYGAISGRHAVTPFAAFTYAMRRHAFSAAAQRSAADADY
jgi:hypothetical protein